MGQPEAPIPAERPLVVDYGAHRAPLADAFRRPFGEMSEEDVSLHQTQTGEDTMDIDSSVDMMDVDGSTENNLEDTMNFVSMLTMHPDGQIMLQIPLASADDPDTIRLGDLEDDEREGADGANEKNKADDEEEEDEEAEGIKNGQPNAPNEETKSSEAEDVTSSEEDSDDESGCVRGRIKTRNAIFNKTADELAEMERY
ncbi:hypothetical protein HK097_011641 [Rhizophlyctis rosea]|uniref:Uncharacterized protein n=1 Tax=Rhizophlyctis rosea TaxID=64517 RepID=A0AAD5S636_9FUNG|nr:hypothetical protein HK097_011641 [Rhizophlyctis rosea]